MMKKKDPDPDLDPYKNMTDPGGPKKHKDHPDLDPPLQ
jgi:hypothetical protein